jgi:hypothetical protein
MRSLYTRRSRKHVVVTSANDQHNEESENGWIGYPPTLAIPELQSVTSGSSGLTNADSHLEKPPPMAVVFPSPPSNHLDVVPPSTPPERHAYASASAADLPPEPYRYSRPTSARPTFEPNYKQQQVHLHQQPSAPRTTSIRSNQTGYYSYDADFSACMTESEVSSSCAGDVYSFGGDSCMDDSSSMMAHLSVHQHRSIRHHSMASSTTTLATDLDVDYHEAFSNQHKRQPAVAEQGYPATRRQFPPRQPAAARISDCDQEPMHRQQSFNKTIEVAPGEYMKLRGSEETWRAVCNDFYMPCTCKVCTETIFCISDADFVLCPTCRVVSLMADLQDVNCHRNHYGNINNKSDGGVGLGFTMKDLAAWQIEIAESRRNPPPRGR